MQAFDLVIVGGGLAGASLAVALRDSHLSIALVENHPPSQPSPELEHWDSRIYALTPASANFLSTIGIWQQLDTERLTPIERMRVCGDAGGEINFSAYAGGVSELGWISESAPLASKLWESIRLQRNVQLFCPASPQSLQIEADTAQLVLSDDRQISARLLVAADGRDSWLRHAAGLSSKDHAYGECGVVANFACQRPHRQTAFQWFRPDGVLAWLPLPGQRFSMVWSTPDAHAAELCALAPADICQRVAAAGAQQLGALELLTPPQALPLRLIRVPETVAPRLALLGDAAHGIHPLSGHGINLGLMDAQALAKQLNTAAAGQDIGALAFLQRYQQSRKQETLLMQGVTHALHELFATRLPGFAPLRNFGLNITNRLPVVKNLLMRYALGG